MNYQKFKQLIICLLFSSFILSGCGSGAKKSQTEAENESVSTSETMEVDALLSEATELIDQPIIVEGICTHICKHGGRKIFLMGSDDTKTIRIEGADMGNFDAKCVNNIVTVNGTLREQRIDEAYLQQWEARLADQAEEKHGNSEAGCSTEKKARNETGNSATQRIADFRKRITERESTEGKAYLSFYYVDAQSYLIN